MLPYMARVGVCLLTQSMVFRCIFSKSFCFLPLYSISEPYIRIGLIKLSDSFSARFGCNLGGGRVSTPRGPPLGNFLEGQAHPNLSSNQVFSIFLP